MSLFDDKGSGSHFGKDAVETLYKLFINTVPRARDVFQGKNTPLKLLHVNDYVMDKAFVYGIVSLSKWLGQETFPYGVFYKWPPACPADLLPRKPAPPSVDI